MTESCSSGRPNIPKVRAGDRACEGAGSRVAQALRREELLDLIRKAGREPVERDTLYRPVERGEGTFTVRV